MGHIRQLRYDSLVRRVSRSVEKFLNTATKKLPREVAEIRRDKRFDGMPKRFNLGDKRWLDFAFEVILGSVNKGILDQYGDSRFVAGDQKDLIRTIGHQCVLAHVLKRSRVFLMDTELIRGIFESTLEWDEGEEINPLFDYVYVEPTKPLEGFEENVVPTGFAFGRVKNLAEIFHTGSSVDFHSVIHGKTDWVAAFLPRDKMSKHLAEDAKYKLAGEFGGKTTGKEMRSVAWYSARLLLYLSSSNIKYEVCERRYTGGSKAKRRNLQKPYYVTSFVKNRKVRIHEDEGEGEGNGSKLEHRVRVRGHFLRRWYCPTCDTTSAVKRFLKGEACRDCGDPLDLKESRVRRYWRAPHWKGPDTAEQAHRAYYKVREGA